jgi:hypothetical protein
MRFMMLVKHGEIQAPPPKEFLDAMAKLGEEAKKSGTMIASGGLSPIAKRERALTLWKLRPPKAPTLQATTQKLARLTRISSCSGKTPTPKLGNF